jgi:hypothetical protein
MRFTRPAHDVRLAGFGVLTPAGAGTAPLLDHRAGAASRRTVPVDPAGLCGDAPDQLRRADRYGALGYAAAALALRDAAVAPSEPAVAIDPGFGVMIGSSVACWSANRRFHEERRDQPAASLSPALFVRTVANAVNGDISIARRLAGPCDTFVSGFTAGAEALIAAAAAIDAGRAHTVLAGGVEAPEGFLEPPPDWFPVEAAGFALVRRGHGDGATTPDDDAPRLVAWHRSHDPAGAFRLAAALDALHPTPIDMILIANRIPGEILGRWRADAGDRPLFALADRAGETGAAGAPIAAALARAAGGAGPAGRAPSPPRASARLILGRDPEGDLAALVVQG